MKDEYYFKEGCFIQEWMNTPSHADMSIARARVDLGQQTKLHALNNTVERYAILSGSGEVTVGQKSWAVSEGDVVVIEAEQPQKINNTGDADLIFLAICTPRFRPSNYVSLVD